MAGVLKNWGYSKASVILRRTSVLLIFFSYFFILRNEADSNLFIIHRVSNDYPRLL